VSFGVRLYICKEADWAAILERGHSHLCGVERWLGLEREVTLILEFFFFCYP
jgi:hypothetical protein